MRIVFLSNFFNHHQAFLSDAFDQATGGQYSFIETSPISEDRKSLGWGITSYPDYVVCSYQSDEAYRRAEQLVLDADAVITGIPWHSLMQKRYAAKKLTFHYSERLFKTGFQPHLYLARFLKYQRCVGFKPYIHLLATSAYAAGDYRSLGLYRNRAYRWAYFPEVKVYDIDAVLAEKKQERTELLWAGRFIDWKHAELAIETAAYLKSRGYRFHLTMIGNGELLDEMKSLAAEKELFDFITFTGAIKPTEVRTYMEKAAIYFFTSDQNEGWGAVLNEAMNSGCAVIADRRIGAAPFLVKEGENGFLYSKKEELFSKAEQLLSDIEKRELMGKKAYKTMLETWNPDVAAKRFLTLAEEISKNGEGHAFSDGPCSKV